MAVKAVSLDIFDTCITRNVARPTDVFYLMAARLADTVGASGPLCRDDLIHELVQLRIGGERRARAAAPAYENGRPLQDIPLERIYAHVDGLGCHGLSPRQMLEAELAAEAEAALPVPEALRLVAQHRGLGRRIVFASDMYLPTDFVRSLLLRHGLAQPDDPVFVSGDIGLTKWHGDLYAHMLEQLSLRPSEVLHVGDNPVSDVERAAQRGIRARLFTGAALTAGERQLVDSDLSWPMPGSLLAGASRAARLHPDAPPAPWSELAASVIAPALVAFVAWVLRDAGRRGVPRLWFVSRDGQILHRIAATLLAHLPDAHTLPECRYLHGSRQAWFLPALTSLDEAAEWLVVPGHSTAPRHILAKLGLTPEDVAGMVPHRPDAPWWDSLPGRDGALAFLRQLASGPAADLVAARAAEARRLTIDYLLQEGVGPDTPLTLVDIGWTLKTQAALRRMLAGHDPCLNVSGYYLGLSQGRIGADRSGPYRGFFTERPLGQDPGGFDRVFFRNANIVEQVFTAADHGQVKGYARDEATGRIEPVLGPAPDAARQALVRATHRTVAQVARMAALGGALDDPDALRAAAAGSLKAFLGSPDPELVRALAGCRVGDDQNESRSRPLARPLTLGDFVAPLLRRGNSADPYEHSFDWLEGTFALSPQWCRRLTQHEKIFEYFRKYRMSR